MSREKTLVGVRDTGQGVAPGVLLRTPAQTAAWILLRRPVAASVGVLMILAIVVVGVVRGSAGGSSSTVSRMVAGVKTMPRVAPKPTFTPEDAGGGPGGAAGSGNSEDSDSPGRDENKRENSEDSEENDTSNTAENSNSGSSSGADSSGPASPSGNTNPPDSPDSPDTADSPPPADPAVLETGSSPAPIPAPQPAAKPVNTAIAARTISCTAPSTISIEAVGTGVITLQTGGQPVTGRGRITAQASGEQIQVTASSQAAGRAYVQFAWATIQGGYCKQSG